MPMTPGPGQGRRGQAGLVIVQQGVAVNAIVLDIIDDQITGVRIVANPDKLGAVNKALSGR